MDSGAHFYDAYETADSKYLAVGAVEPKFYANLLRVLGIEACELAPQMDQTQWPAMKQKFAAEFRTRTRDAWMAAFEGAEACVSPVLTLGEVHSDPHIRARGVFVESAGQMQPAPTPRFNRTPASLNAPPGWLGQHTEHVLAESGYSSLEIQDLRTRGVIA